MGSEGNGSTLSLLGEVTTDKKLGDITGHGSDYARSIKEPKVAGLGFDSRQVQMSCKSHQVQIVWWHANNEIPQVLHLRKGLREAVFGIQEVLEKWTTKILLHPVMPNDDGQ